MQQTTSNIFCYTLYIIYGFDIPHPSGQSTAKQITRCKGIVNPPHIKINY